MKPWFIGVSAVTLLSFSGMPSAFANTAQLPMTATAPALHVSDPNLNADPGRPDRRFEVNSSVQVSREVLREAYDASRAAYTKKLQRYAKCSPVEAKKAIASAHPNMKIDNFQLRNVRTNLVYIGTAENDEDRFLVIVDAGNGKVLLDRPIPTHHERVFAGGQ